MKAPEVRIAGIPVRFEPVFFVIIVILGLGQEPKFVASWVVVATISVLLHELGHAVAFRAYGLQPSVVLHGLGGLTTGEGALGPGARIVTSLAGPLAALVLLGLPAVMLEWSDAIPPGDARTVLSQVVWVNVGWSVLNLVPVLPLDGGQVFLAVCDLFTKGRGRRVAEILSVVVAGAIAVWAYQRGFVFGALLAGGLAALNLSHLRRVHQDELLDELSAAHRALLGGDVAEADTVLARVARARPSGETRRWLEELAGWSELFQGRVGSAPAPGLGSPGVPGPGHRQPEGPEDTASASLRAACAMLGTDPEGGIALAAWALAHDDPALPKSLLAVAVSRAGVAAPVASELVLLGDPGRQGAALLRDLLGHLGHRSAAAEVASVLS
jgi:Zn-dependent protease